MTIFEDTTLDLPLTGDESVEELVDTFPGTIRWLSRRNVVCIVCGEAYWGSLRELSESKGIKGEEFDKLLHDLNTFLESGGKEQSGPFG